MGQVYIHLLVCKTFNLMVLNLVETRMIFSNFEKIDERVEITRYK